MFTINTILIILAKKSASCFKKCFLIVALLKFTFGKTKASFNITHGLAHYFHDLVYNSVLQSDHIVVCFDESLNEVVQKGQMDLYVCHWDANKSQAATRYFDSSFFGHVTANNLQSSFTSLLNDQILSKTVQVSMDNPKINLKFLDQPIDQLEIQSEKSLLDMGSCGLHSVHGAFQNGNKNAKWNVNTAL